MPRRSIAFVVALTLAGCGGGSDRSVKKFCSELTTSQAVFSNGAHDGATIADEFHRVGSHAPVDVQPPWNELTALFDFLAKVDTSNQASVQAGYQRAEAKSVSEAATAVTSYVKTTCGFDLAMPSVTTPAAP